MSLDKLIKEAIPIITALDRLPSGTGRKLSKSAWIKIVDADCDTNDEVCAEAEKRLKGSPLNALIKKIAQEVIRKPEFPTPLQLRRLDLYVHPDRHKLEMAHKSITLAHLYAIASRRAAESDYGEIEDWDSYVHAEQELRDKLHDLFLRMQQNWSATDLVFSDPGTAELRKLGMMKVSFRRAPTLNPTVPDWQLQLVRLATTESRAA